MTRYFIDDVSEGMILNVEIHDDLGNVAFKKGEVLTAVTLDTIKELGYLTIDAIENVDSAQLRTQQQLITTKEMLSPKIDKVFQNYESNPLMMKIKELALESIRKFANLQQYEA